MVGWRQGTRQRSPEVLLRCYYTLRMESCFVPQINYGIMDEDDDLGTPSSSSEADSTNSNESSGSELTEDATSPAAASSTSPPSQDPRSLHQVGAAYEMSSLRAQLPFKRGLSKHFQGKSRSFTSLSNVRCVEDLAKPGRPYRKKLKPCKSYATGLDTHKPHSPSRTISKKPSSRGALPCLVVKRAGFVDRRQASRPGASTQIRRFFDSTDRSFCLNEG